MTTHSLPAFQGAPFDSTGSCLHHPEVKLSQKTVLNGRFAYKELRRSCPKCTTSANGSLASSSVTSTPSRRTYENFEAHSSRRQNVDTRTRSSSRQRSSQRENDRSRTGPSPSNHRRTTLRKEFDTPFDSKGRCHHHAHVQLAKKKLTGGWKVLLNSCPTCIQETNNNDTFDQRSTTSRHSRSSQKSSRSVRSNTSHGILSSSKARLSLSQKNQRYESCPFNALGYCHQHSHIRLAKKKTLGGWKILQSFCPECAMNDNGEDAQSFYSRASSRGSRHSRASSSRVSHYSRRSGKSWYSESGGETDTAYSTSQSDERMKRLVKKMEYTDCDNGASGWYSGYVNSEYKPHGEGKMTYWNGNKFDGTWCEGSKVHGKTSKGKASTSTENKSGKRSEDDRKGDRGNTVTRGNIPQAMPTRNRSSTIGVSKVTREKIDASKQQERQQPQQQQDQLQQALKDYRDLYRAKAKMVKSMKFIDFYGDPGRYSGEVNDVNMPHGNGVMTYDHGLIQEGEWRNGILDEGSTYT